MTDLQLRWEPVRWGKGEKLLRDFNGKKLITFFLLMLLNLKEQRDGKKNDFAWYCKLHENGCVICILTYMGDKVLIIIWNNSWINHSRMILITYINI